MITVMSFRKSMKMNIWEVAVFCAYLAAAFGEESNSTMPSKLTGKSLPPSGIHSQLRTPVYSVGITQKLSTIVLIHRISNVELGFGVLLGQNRIAIPELYEECLHNLMACAHCIKLIPTGQMIAKKCIDIDKKVPEGERLYLADKIIEVQIIMDFGQDCWYEGEERYTEPADDIVVGSNATAVGIPYGKNIIVPKPYTIFQVWSIIVQINEPLDPIYKNYVPGEPLFYEKRIAGMFIPRLSTLTAPRISYIRLRRRNDAGSRP